MAKSYAQRQRKMNLPFLLLLVISGHECMGTTFTGTSRKPRSAPGDRISFLHFTMAASFGGNSISPASLCLKEASSGFGAERSPIWPLLFLGLPWTLSYKSKSLQLLAVFYMFCRCCLALLSRERAVLRRNQLTRAKNKKVQRATEALRSVADSKSLVWGKRQR